jgi:hypothetical protein
MPPDHKAPGIAPFPPALPLHCAYRASSAIVSFPFSISRRVARKFACARDLFAFIAAPTCLFRGDSSRSALSPARVASDWSWACSAFSFKSCTCSCTRRLACSASVHCLFRCSIAESRCRFVQARRPQKDLVERVHRCPPPPSGSFLSCGCPGLRRCRSWARIRW